MADEDDVDSGYVGPGAIRGVYDGGSDTGESDLQPLPAAARAPRVAAAATRGAVARHGINDDDDDDDDDDDGDDDSHGQRDAHRDAARGIFDYSESDGYVTTNDKVVEVMGRVKDVLSREVLLGEGYADANVAEQILNQLTTSINSLMRDESGAPPASRHVTGHVTAADFDGSSVTGTDVMFAETDSEMGYNPLSKEELRERRAEKGKKAMPWSQKLWDAKLREMRAHSQQSQQKLEYRARLAGLEEKRAAKREKERRRKLLEQAGYDWVGKFDGAPPSTLKQWETTFGERLRKYDETKARSMTELKEKLKEVDEQMKLKHQPPKLEKVEIDGRERYAWTDEKGKLCLVDETLELKALEDDTWVYKRLMQRARDREETNAKKVFLAKQRQAERELEECFFVPQIKTTLNTRSPRTKDRARELGYSLKAVPSKRQVEEEAYPFSPSINNLSRKLVQPEQYRSTEEVINRLAVPRRVEAEKPPVEESDDAQATFKPAINRRSAAMERDVTVYDRLYNIGMQQILEKRRLQADFWDNYTRLEKPQSLRLPGDPFDGLATPDRAARPDDTSFGPYGGSEMDVTRSVALDRTRAGGDASAVRAPRSMAEMLGEAQQSSTQQQQQQQQDAMIGMSPAEFLAVYSR